MILGRTQAKEIESHFYWFTTECERIDRKKAEIAEESTVPQTDGVRVSASRISDPTPGKAGKIEKALKSEQAWVDVVKKTIRRFKGTPQADFITMVYLERKTVDNACSDLYITRSTYFQWREKILNYALILAVECGLYKIS